MENDSEINAIEINKIWYNLEDLEQFAWKKLLNGSLKKRNGFRNLCLGTLNSNSEPALRMVVNRKVDETNKLVFFHTDTRSRKFEDLQNNATVSLLFYDARQKIQIAIKAQASIHHNDAISSERWQFTSPHGKLAYMTINPPNTTSEKPTTGCLDQFAQQKPTEVESEIYKQNFAVIACQAYALEFLYLGYQGNYKANFFYTNGQLEQAHWAVP